MKHFLFKCLGEKSNDDYCFTTDTPEGGVDSYDLIAGFRLSDEYPDGIEDVVLRLEDKFPGLELASFIGNANRLLAFSVSAAQIITFINQAETETIPFTLLNSKGKVHSKDYVFINPVGSWDCINWKKSVCERNAKGDIKSYEKLVFSREKLVGAPHLFRVKHKTSLYLFSEALIKALLDAGHTNLVFEDIEAV
ncbi:imm11 family protein [Hahella sp. NBU794]|uniref:imm11 family protein n=1 Tax=Hahella sp. NBU794 TaxID=3422590 RepID=UPI003D6E3067